jgi:geranylgeranyl diphosphate synthase type II
MSVQQAPGAGLGEVLQAWTVAVDRDLKRRIDDRLECPKRLQEAMRYSLFAGGKRLRPLLVLMASEACLGPFDEALPAAAAVEMVHTYSLIHDDLPAMDDDDFRRGIPTCHKRFDEATAILAGDALLTLAFECLTDLPAGAAAECVRELAAAAGAAGMVGGQSDDLNAASGPGTLEWLESLHARKTGALLEASLRMGGIVAGADREQLDALTQYGRAVGLAFQIADDLLDVEGDPDKVGKGVRKDDAAGKLTFPGLVGVEASRKRAWDLVDRARDALAPFGPAGVHLVRLAKYVVERDR